MKESVFGVSEVNEYIKMTLERQSILSSVWVRGEISNFKNQFSTGHLYMSLKDSDGMIRAVMFKSSAQRLRFTPRDGDKVIVHGRISVYPQRGEYQIYIDSMQPDGVGALALAFERLKEKLSLEGLFDEKYKKPIPKNPTRVGIITSATGAAIHDMISVSGRRAPDIPIVIYPALVQGESAARSLSGGIKYFNNESLVDVIIIGRGGGSSEDLFAFNDEELARTIFASNIPVVSAVGHETDFTICDFVSDMRAPTPSAAAEIVFPNREEMRGIIAAKKDLMHAKMQKKLSEKRRISDMYAKKIATLSPIKSMADKQMRIMSLTDRIENGMDKKVRMSEYKLKVLAARMSAQDPLAVLSRGYALVSDDKGKIVSRADDLKVGDKIKLAFSDGYVNAEIK